jgi:hypothetical protein
MPQCVRIRNVDGRESSVSSQCAAIFDNAISRDELCEFWWTNVRSGFNPKGKKL